MNAKVSHIFILIGLLVNLNQGFAQQKRLSKATYEALNNYVVYSNEVVYALNIMYSDFTRLNAQFNNYVEDKELDSLSYSKQNVLTNYDYFPVFPRDLYNKIYDDNIYIPYDQRGAPLQLVGKVVSVLEEIENHRNQLERYIQSDAYRQDTNLTKGYKLLRRVEVLYYDMFTLQEKLHWNLSTIIKEYNHPQRDSSFLLIFYELQPLVTQTKTVIKAIRADDQSSSLRYHIAKLAELARQLQHKKSELFAGVENDPNSLKSPLRRFDEIIGRAQNVLEGTKEFSSYPKYQNLLHPPYYYYYNVNMLKEYNRYGDGAATLFNKMIKNSSIYWLFEHEMPFLFQVVYPDIPAYDNMKKDTLPDPEVFIRRLMVEKARQDSIRQVKMDSIALAKQDSLIADSIASMKANPDVGDPSLNGFATNNLVFLLDISSSMDDPNKLPLLKDAMTYLLELMRPEDNITLITYSNKAEILLPPTSATQKDTILDAISNLKTLGKSNANKGLSLAYKTIKDNHLLDGNNKIILATDGGFRIKRKTKRIIKRNAATRKSSNLSVFYFSKKEYDHNKELLEQLAEWGRGRYSYIKKENAEKTLLIEAQAVRKNK